jgi:hypothetical protein
MQYLLADDITITLTPNDDVEFRRTSDGKLLCTARGHTTKDHVAAAWNAAIWEGIDLGRRNLQDELKEALGIANAGRA